MPGPRFDQASIALARAAAAVVAPLINAVFWGGSHRLLNPSFPLSIEDARADLARMRRDPRPLARPVLVCAGIFDPGPGSRHVAGQLRAVTSTPELVLDTGFARCADFDACRDHALRLVECACPSGTRDGDTVPLDALGISMGGIVARYAALPRRHGEPAGSRLNLRTLYTFGTPHHGAQWWDRAPWDQRAADMRPGSPFMGRLNGDSGVSLERSLPTPVPSPPSFDIIAYVRLGDTIVGESNAAAPDGRVWWAPNPISQFAHLQAFDDPRLLADVARRLRGEPPLTFDPPAPIPAPDDR